MRTVLIALATWCALSLTTAAHAQTDWTVKPEPATAFAPYGHRSSDIGWSSPIVLNSESNGPVDVRILPYRPDWSRLYEAPGSRNEDFLVQFDLKKVLPQPFAVQMMAQGLKRLYDSKKVKVEDTRFSNHLPVPDETKYTLSLKYKY